MFRHLAIVSALFSTFIGLRSAQAQSAYSNAVAGLQPVAYWPLNETTAPPNPALAATNLGSLGAAFDATYGGSVTLGAAGALAGTADTSAGFDGLSAKVETPYGTAIAPSPSFTIEAWLLSHNVGATQCPISDVDAASPRSGWLIYMDIANPGQYTFRAYNQNGTTPSLSMNIGSPGSILQDQWNHLVVVVSNAVTATNVYAYVNGVLVTGPTALPGFVPNDGASGATFALGERSDTSFQFDGNIDEVAFYGTALDPATIAAHYSAGTTGSGAAYSTAVLASSPALYFRLDEPAAPVAYNYGSLGAAANGYYETGTLPGVAGPSFGAFANGFGSQDFATEFSTNDTQSASSGPTVTCAGADPSILNFTNSITVSAWVKAPTNTVGWFTGILGRGDNSYRFALDTGGLPHFADGTGNADIVGVNAINDGHWHFWVGTYDSSSSNATLYIDSVLAGTAVWSPFAGNADEEFVIGGAPDYNGRNFPGEVAQVAIFTNVLSLTNLQALHNSTAPSPYQLAVLGLGPLAYWPLTETAQPPPVGTFVATNAGTVGSALNANFTGDVVYGVAGALASTSDSADGFNGSTTAAVAPYTPDLANAPSFTIEAWLRSHNIGATQCPVCNIDAASPRSGWLIYMDISNPGQYTFRAYAQNGTTPALALNIGGPGSVLQDQWNHLVVVVSNGVTVTNVYGYLNGVLVAGPTALPAYVPNDGISPATFTIGERSDDAYLFDGDVDEVAYYTNALDANAVLAHYQAGTNASPATPYSQLVLKEAPIVYYHLDEASAGNPYPVAPPVANNYGSAGPAANGYFESGTLPGVPGPFGSNSLACMFVATNGGPVGTSGPGVLCDPYDLTVLNATNALTIAAWVQVPTTPNTAFETVLGRSDSSFRLSVDTTQLPHFAAAPNSDLVGTTAINDGNWHLWTGVYDPASGKADLYIDGLVEASASWSALNSFEQVVLIGGAPDYNGTGTRAFAGSVSDVAIFTNALTQAQIQATYATIGVPPSPPIIVQQPVASEILFVGATLSAGLTVSGPGPFTYQWYYNTSNQIAGATSAALSLANVQTTNGGSYDCVVSNRYGGTNSANLVLTVVSPLSDKYDAAVLATKAVAFYPLNETSGTTAYEYVQGNNGTYQTNSLIGQPGVEDPPYLGFPATDFSVDIQGTASNSWVAAPFGSLAGSNDLTIPNLTLTCWIYPVGVQNVSTGLIFDRGGATGGLGISPSGGATTGMLGYVWNNNNADTYDFVSNLTPPDSQWSLVALSIAPTEAVLYLYSTNGRASSTNLIPHFNGLLDGAWRLGNDAVADPGRTYNGMIDAVAVFPSSLSPAQMNALFDSGAFGTTNVAPIVVVPSNPITVDQGGSGSIISTIIDGPPPFSYQWFYLVSGTTNLVSGATNGTLPLTDIQSVQSSYQYFVVVSNSFGAATSSFATLNILSGPPTLVADVSPLLTEVPSGTSVSLSVAVTGTEPFSYQWSTGSGFIAGATNSSYVFGAVAGSNNYFVTVSNSVSAINSSTAAVVGVTNAPAVLGFNGTGSNWTLNQFPGVIFLPFITNNILELTDGNTGESSSAFYNTPQYVGSFIASYTYQVGAASSVADGVTFCLQDSTNTTDEDATNVSYGVGPGAVGGGGGDLGYNGITPSVAFQMNVYTGSSGGVGIGFATNGLTVDSTPANPPYGGTAPVNISSFDPILVQLYYRQGELTVSLTDGKLAYKTNYFCDIPATLGSSSAFVGFTGASGGVGGLQTVSDFQFSYTTDPILSVTPGTSGSVTVSWPVSITTLLELQESSTLLGPWSKVAVTPTIVGGENQVTLSPGTSSAFFRLSIQ